MPIRSSASRRRQFFVAFALFLALGFHVGVWAVQLGALAASLRLDPGRLGVALGGAAAGGIVTLFVGGRLADRFGRRAVLIVGFGVAAVAFLGLGLARTFAEVVAAVVLYGLVISFVDLGANAVGSDFERQYRASALTLLQAGFSLGAVIGALGSAVLVSAGIDYRAIYVGLAIVFLGTAVGVIRAPLPESRRGATVAEAPGPAAGPVWRNRGVLFATAVVLVTFFGDGALEGFLAVFLRETLASGVLLSGVGIAAFHLASFLGRSIAGRLGDRVSPRRVIPASGLLAAAGITVAVLAPGAGVGVAGLLLVGFAISPVIPFALSLAGRSAPIRAAGAVAFTTAFGYTSFLVSPLLVGAVANATDLRTGLGLVVVTALLLAALGTRWPRVSEVGG